MNIACIAGVQMGGKGKDERVKHEKIGRGRIAVPSPSRTHFDFPPFLQPATQATLNGNANSRIYGKFLVMFQFSKKLPKPWEVYRAAELHLLMKGTLWPNTKTEEITDKINIENDRI